MKLNRFLAFTLAMLMILSTMTFNVFAGETPTIVAKIGDTGYATLKEAVDAAQNGETIILQKDASGDGIHINGDEKKDITIDLNNHTYTVNGNAVGFSSVTTTNAIRVADGFKVTLKNGTITSTKGSGVKFIIQNYSYKLTLENIVLDGRNLDDGYRPGTTTPTSNYTLSNNCGNVTIKDTKIISRKNCDPSAVAFDACGENTTVTVSGNSDIDGVIEVYNGKLIIESGVIQDKITTGSGFVASNIETKGGTFNFDPSDYVAEGYRAVEDKGKWTVEVKTADNAVVESVNLEQGETTGTVSKGIDESLQAVAKSVAITSSSAIKIADSIKQADMDNYIKEAREDAKFDFETEDLFVYQKPYLKVNVDEYDSTEGILTLDITPYVDIYVSTTNDPDNLESNSKVFRGEKVETTKNIELTIQLPASFATVGDTVYINHKELYGYTAEVDKDRKITFTSTGLSPFQFSTQPFIYDLNVTNGTVYINDDTEQYQTPSAVSAENGTNTTTEAAIGADVIVIPAKAEEGMIFDKWEIAGNVTPSAVTEYPTGTVKFRMPGQNVTLEALYKASTELEEHSITVTNGKAYVVENMTERVVTEATSGTAITIKPDILTGKEFANWEVVKGNVSLKDATSKKTTFIMLDEDVEIKAVYKSTSTGGGSGSSDYAISVEDTENGKIKVSDSRASKGDIVTITVTPDDGYVLGELIVKDAEGNQIAVTEKDGKYTFEMPGTKVTIEATFVKASIELPYTDIDSNAYYIDALRWAVENGITNGTTATTFSPDMNCTRAEMITFLWRAKGSEIVEEDVPFTDVDKDAYYYDALKWAVKNNITKGIDETTFGPDVVLARAQVVTFMWRLDGMDKVSTSNTFTDVDKDAYYSDAVLWAAENDITNGTSATTFSPDNACTRAQIVTFLYRFIVGK